MCEAQVMRGVDNADTPRSKPAAVGAALADQEAREAGMRTTPDAPSKLALDPDDLSWRPFL